MYMWYNFVIDKIFQRYFKTFEYPFDRSDKLISQMKAPERKEYFRQAKDVLENRAIKQEIQEVVRQYYQELAIKTQNPVEQMAYRLALKALQDLNGRFLQLSNTYMELQPKYTDKLTKL